jgi:hypothetical protein
MNSIFSKYVYSLFLIIVILLSGFLLNLNIVHSEGGYDLTEIVDITDEALKLNLTIGSQEFMTKVVTVELEINPSIDSGKVAVDWLYDDQIFKIIGNTKDIIKLDKNQKLVISKKFTPITKYSRDKDFDTKLVAKVNAAAFEINYLSIRTTNVKMNKSYEVFPLLEQYQQSKNISLIIGIVISTISAFIIIVTLALLIKIFIKYLNTNEET